MNDYEARYLIGQYNKYASWDVRSWEIMLSFAAVIIAANALLLSTVKQDTWRWVITLSFFAVVLIVADRAMDADRKKRSEHKNLLLLLEGYRSDHKSQSNKALPDGITFKLIAKEPEKAEKLLKDSEPAPMGSPQTSGSR